MDDWMKVCKYCRFFKEDYCMREVFKIDVENNIDIIIEDGLIEEAIREGFSNKAFNSISKKKQGDFTEEFEQAKNNWVEEISEHVAIMLRNNFSFEYGVMPKDSREFYCSKWD